MDNQKTLKQAKDGIDLKVMKLLQTEGKELTLKEIAVKTGEKPQAILKSIWKIFLNNDKLRTEHALDFYV